MTLSLSLTERDGGVITPWMFHGEKSETEEEMVAKIYLESSFSVFLHKTKRKKTDLGLKVLFKFSHTGV